MSEIEIDKYEVRDLYAAVACIVGGCKFVGIRKVDQGYFHFVFDDSPSKCEAVLDQYRLGVLTAPVKVVVDTIFRLKHLMGKEKYG